MIPVLSLKMENAITVYKTEIENFILNAIGELKSLKGKSKKLSAIEISYIDNLIKDLPKIVIASPDDLQSYLATYPILPKHVIPKSKKNKKKQKSLSEKIISALGYESLRSDFYPKFFNKIGIKSCVYCNSMLTVTIENEKLETKAKFQLDHYISKSDYPCFSISLFNLYPVCGPCNNVKSKKVLEFELYTKDDAKTKVSNFNFSLVRGSVANYLLSKNPDDLEIIFSEPPIIKTGSSKFQETFDITGIYNTQKDLAEELIIKARIYNAPYKKILIDAFPKLFSNISLSNRVLIGNYMEPENIHKRPMAKFTQDIAKQLKLI